LNISFYIEYHKNPEDTDVSGIIVISIDVTTAFVDHHKRRRQKHDVDSSARVETGDPENTSSSRFSYRSFTEEQQRRFYGTRDFDLCTVFIKQQQVKLHCAVDEGS
jgi:hypothetical protein